MRKSKFKAVSFQFEVSPYSIDLNLQAAESFVKSAVEDCGQIDLVVFPEYAWTAHPNSKSAEQIPTGGTCRAMIELARRYSTFVVSGSIVEKSENGSLYLTSLLFDRDGRILGKHRKISLVGREKQVKLDGKSVVGMKDELGSGIEPGKTLEPITTELGKVGLLLGADLDTPEAARTLVLKGAEILISPVSFESKWVADIEFLGRARAYENSAYVIISNRSGEWQSPEGHLAFGGGSAIFSPMGEVISNAGTRQISSYALAVLDLDFLHRIRDSFNMLNLRHPNSYEC